MSHTVATVVVHADNDPLRYSYQYRPYIRSRNDFNSECYNCCDDRANCLDVFFCWYLQVSSMYDAVNTGDREHKPQCVTCLMVCLGDLFLFGLVSNTCVGLTRMGIRDLFGFRCEFRDGCLDCLMLCCMCGCCLACQNHREMHMRGVFAGGCFSVPRRDWVYPELPNNEQHTEAVVVASVVTEPYA